MSELGRNSGMAKVAPPDTYQGYRVVTAAEMQEIDRRAVEKYGIPVKKLMENAGKGVAREIARFCEERLKTPVANLGFTVCCGRGNNGGDGLVAARILRGMGARTGTFIAAPREGRLFSPEIKENLRLALASGVAVVEVGDGEDAWALLEASLKSSDLAVDALLGTGSGGKPAGIIRKMIQAMMKSGKPIIAVDIPTGMQPDTGYHSGVFICAALTLTLGFPKRGLLAPHAQRYVGELRVLDIGFPPEWAKGENR